MTEGRPYATDVVPLDPAWSRADVLGWAARAEAGSEHPLARPIVEVASAEGLDVTGLPEATEPVPGKGIVAVLDGHRVAVGNLALLEDERSSDAASAVVEDLAAAGRTPMAVSVDGRPVGVVAVADRVRPGAARMVADLHAAGVKRVVMLTGDVRRVAEAVAAQVGVDEVHAGL
ncbi:HAD family hydrolase, partial [Actinomadura sp.]|uniref:HAD family hydrolase n=1 Tax=Actinomadura sp. TaxID=1989 RepID=UPI0037C847F7